MVVLRALIQLTLGITGQMRQLNKSIWNFRFVKTLEAATACGEGNEERRRFISRQENYVFSKIKIDQFEGLLIKKKCVCMAESSKVMSL